MTPTTKMQEGGVSDDVIALVVAVRLALDDDAVMGGHNANLFKAVEAFASRVCYDDEGGDIPEAHGEWCRCERIE